MKQVFHVAVVSGKIAGVMGYKPDKEGADHVYWAVWLYIDRKYMRKGIASRLWKSIEQNMIEKGARKCYLDVGNESDQPEAIAFHKKQGFELEGVMKDYWKDGEDMMLFGKRLKPFGEGEQYMNQVKFVSLEQLAKLVGKYKNQGKTVVHCHGCFDLYHVGHLRHMKKLKNQEIF
ncbi:GNAT family N-acetyltransferase [Bacillus pacificus]|nr:GNAT family N-acetyltransferase [Bacillus pacificus]